MSIHEYSFEVSLEDDVEMVESTSSSEEVVTSDKKQERNLPSDSIPISYNCNTKSSKNTQLESPNHLDVDDCMLIHSDDYIDLGVKRKSKTKKRKFPKSLKAKLLEHAKQNGDSTNETRLQESESNVSIESNHNTIRNEEPIVIEEDSEKDNDCDIECTSVESSQNQTETTHSNCDKIVNFEEILRKDKVFADLIEMCLDMENSMGMQRIINRTVIPIYKNTSKDFKLSDPFKRHITKTMAKLQNEPIRKFTHLKEFCEFMKSGIHKKRVQFTTLKTNLNGKFSSTVVKTKSQMNSSSSMHIVPNKKKKICIINLDDDDDIVPNEDIIDTPLINNQKNISVNENLEAEINTIQTSIDENIMPENDAYDPKKDDDTETTNNTEISSQNEMQILIQDVRSEAAGISNTSDNIHIENTNVNKENKIKANEESITNTQNKHHSNKIVDEMDVICIDDENDNYNKENMSDSDPRYVLQTKIEKLKSRIKYVNDIIKKYEERELDWDKDNDEKSPYVVCEYYKEVVTRLFKKLCKLTGIEAVKRRQVHLKVAEGRHAGPVRFLEEFINSRIDENGNPPFPDIQDVINCVSAANIYHNIGWSKKDIEMEARALFIHLGRMFQKKRQKREWRHLMRYVKEEVVDPADGDAELHARLEENARVALKNEAELFDRYAELDGMRSTIDQDYATLLAEVAGPSNVQHNHKVAIPRLPPTSPNNSRLELNSYKDSCNGKITENIEMYNASAPNQSMVTLPNVVAVPFNMAVNESMVPVIYYTNTDGDPVLNHFIPTSIHTEDTTNRDNMEPERNSNEREMIEIEIDMKPDLNQLNDSHRNLAQCTVVPAEFESNGGNRNVQVNENNNTEIPNSNLTNSNNAQRNSKQQMNGNSNEINAETFKTVTLQEKQASRNTTKSTVYNDGCSISVYTHRTQETEVSENSNTNEQTPDNIGVKQEPLDIPQMLAALGDNYTVSILDIQDPFEVIEISDSSDSEDENL